MRIFVTGGTGFVGGALSRRLAELGHQVTILTRSMQKKRDMPQGVTLLSGDPTQEGEWQQKVPDHEAVINLAGESIFRRWTAAAKRLIRDSRILTTRNLVQALSQQKAKETLLLSASAVGYYGFCEDEVVDEDSTAGNDFLALVAQGWEAEARRAEGYDVRVVLCRFGIILGRGGGALEQMLPVFRFGLGSPLGTGTQWFPWIHQEDLVSILVSLIDRKDVAGPVNCTAPQPVRNRDMTKILGEVMRKPLFMPAVPSVLLKLAMGEMGAVLLKGQRALPKRLLKEGFKFQFPTLKEALKDLVVKDLVVKDLVVKA